jgi:hypothetical protein
VNWSSAGLDSIPEQQLQQQQQQQQLHAAGLQGGLPGGMTHPMANSMLQALSLMCKLPSLQHCQVPCLLWELPINPHYTVTSMSWVPAVAVQRWVAVVRKAMP